MKKIMLLVVIPFLILANGDNVSMFPSTSDTVDTYIEKCIESARVGKDLIKFSYFNPSTWFSRTQLSLEQIQAVHTAYVWDKGFSIALSHANPDLYILAKDQIDRDAQIYAQLLYQWTLPKASANGDEISVELIQEEIEKSIDNGIVLAKNGVSSPTFGQCVSLRDALLFHSTGIMMTEGDRAKLAPEQYQKDMTTIFGLLQKCSKYSE